MLCGLCVCPHTRQQLHRCMSAGGLSPLLCLLINKMIGVLALPALLLPLTLHPDLCPLTSPLCPAPVQPISELVDGDGSIIHINDKKLVAGGPG